MVILYNRNVYKVGITIYSMTKHSNMKETRCPNCNGINIVRRGQRETENRGLIQRYGCKDCKKRFIENDGFWKMKNGSQKVTLCLDLFYKGVSTRQIQSHLKSFYPHNASWVSIYKWIVKYSKQISKFTDKLKLNTSSYVEMDEMEYHRRKSHRTRKGTDENWFIDVIDPKTKFMVASKYCKSRSQNEVKRILNVVKEKTDKIRIITTDGWLAYPNAIKKVFGFSNKTHQVNVIHNKKNASAGDGFNYSIERLHSNIRHRTKTFRGFHGCLSSASSIMKGYEIYYNFIREHQAIGKCPYEKATNLKLKNPNKWIELIGLSEQRNN